MRNVKTPFTPSSGLTQQRGGGEKDEPARAVWDEPLGARPQIEEQEKKRKRAPQRSPIRAEGREEDEVIDSRRELRAVWENLRKLFENSALFVGRL